METWTTQRYNSHIILMKIWGPALRHKLTVSKKDLLLSSNFPRGDARRIIRFLLSWRRLWLICVGAARRLKIAA